MKNKVGEQLYNDLKVKENMCVLNLIRRNFDKMCYDINEILIKNNLFLRVYELKDKFRYLFHQNEEGTKVQKSVSDCIKEKFNGFNIAAPTFSKKEKKDLFLIDIIYKPVRSREEIVECFFSTDIKTSLQRFFYKGRKNRNVSPLGVLLLHNLF